MPRKSLKLPKQRKFIAPAPAWKRILAFIIDMLIIDFVIAFPFRDILLNIIPRGSSYTQAYRILLENQSSSTLITIVTFAISGFALLYFSILEWKLGQTIGKIILNINIISDNKTMRLWQALVRSIFIVPIFPLILLWIIDPLFLLFNKNKQRLSEILSKTKTIQSYEI